MRIMVIPDTQVKPGSGIEHLHWAGQYAVDQKPDVIVFIGDHWDMPSLSSYDKGKKAFEGRRYTKDIEAGKQGMDAFLRGLWMYQEDQKKLKNRKMWKPRLIFTLGNHEDRISRAVNDDPKLEGLIGLADLGLTERGFEVYPYLEVVEIEGVLFSHFFTSGTMGRPVSSARALLTKKMMSCVMGHVQDRDIAFGRKGNGQAVTGLFAGIFYQHYEDYLGKQGNKNWAGVWILNEVNKGSFDELPVSMGFLRKKYGTVKKVTKPSIRK
jgi:hypothetical protein